MDFPRHRVDLGSYLGSYPMSQQMSGTPSTPDVKSSLPIADIFKTPDHLDRTPESASTKASIKTSPAREPSTQNVDVTLAQALGWPEECRILLRRVQTGQPLSDRVYAANALGNAVDEFSLGSVTQIWSAAKDLIASDLPKDARRAGFSLLASCVKQPNLAPLERRQFFETLSRPCNIDDFGLQLKALVDLTNHGKDVSSFESVLLPWVTKLLEEWFVAARSSRKRAKEKKTKPVSATSHENNLNDLFGFVKELVRFSFVTFQGQELCLLLDQILQICKSTTAESDIRNSIDIIDMLVTYGEVPPTKHALILEVLCGAYAFLENLKELTWKVIGNFCKSHLASNTVVILLSFIHSSNEDSPPRNSHCIRGALLVIDGLMKARGSEGLFLVTFSIWMDAIEKALETDNARLDFDVIHAVAGFLQTDPLLNDAVQEEDLSRLFSALTTCSRSTPDAEVDLPVDKRLSGISQKVSESKKERDPKLTVLQDLSQIFEILETQYSNLPVLRGPIVRYFFSVRSLLPDSSAALLVKHYTKEQLCHPSHEDWSDNMATLVRTFFEDRQRQAPLRLLILSMAYDVYEAASIHLPPDPIKGSFLPLIESMRFETDIDVLEHMVTLAVLMANHSHEEVFSSVMECFNACREAFKETTSSRASSSSSSEISANKVSLWPSKAVSTLQSSITSGIVRIFLRTMNRSAGRAIEAFDMLLEIARSQSNATTEARLTALKLLFRLRSDSSSSIMVLDSIDVANTANLLGRTVNSLEKRMADGKSYDRPAGDNTESTLPSRKKSIQHLQRQFNHSKTENRAGGASDSTRRLLAPLWAFPESKALPEAPPKRPSDVLVSSSDALQSAPSPEAALEVNTDTIPYKRVLNIKMWLELLISNVREYNNWEVYSYTIVYLQNQLANHSLFVESVPQIQMLRSVLCDHIRAANFLDGLNVRDVKRADVAVCLVHLLTGLVSYHTLFSKNEQDDLVRTFVFGMGSGEGAAKPCIHALSICCHEIPLSVSKSLNTILQKLSQIITQSQVSIHVLEFLVGLSRTAQIYVNFRDEEYRTIFGICFRYLQYVRDEREKVSGAGHIRSSQAPNSQAGLPRKTSSPDVGNSSPNATEDLPQYVYALAYHVITFWFMSLKMVDRAKHIGWITKNLVSTDATGKEVLDEQAQVTVDMMQRVTYSDLDETLPDTQFVSSLDHSIIKKTWLMGLSLLTVETAVATGESQLTKRQPSATTYSLYRSAIAPRPSHQIPLSPPASTDIQERDRAAVLPSHIMLQLSLSCAQTPESMRPIALPDDDAVKRAIGAFDRIPTLDGHKVGVIYISENQSSEQEILANVGGSSDYNEFLARLATLVRLKGATFNTQGLDRENDSDGEWAYCWRDRVTEMVFHVTTLMPTDLEHDPGCSLKKRHTGNDYVNIIFNNSGSPFEFDTFPSQFNFVNIVITPEANASHTANRLLEKEDLSNIFYIVRVLSKAGFPEISPAADAKVVSGKTLPVFVRTLALNASVFSLVWAHRNQGDELVSSWRSRLRQIKTLREKYSSWRPSSSSIPPSSAGSATTSSSNAPSATGGMMGQFHGSRDSHVQRENLNLRRTSAANFFSDALGGGGVTGGSARSSVVTVGSDMETVGRQEESLVEGYDFSKWV